MTYVYKDIDGLKTLRIWVGKYIKHILNKGAKYTKKYCKNGAKRSEILCIILQMVVFKGLYNKIRESEVK